MTDKQKRAWKRFAVKVARNILWRVDEWLHAKELNLREELDHEGNARKHQQDRHVERGTGEDLGREDRIRNSDPRLRDESGGEEWRGQFPVRSRAAGDGRTVRGSRGDSVAPDSLGMAEIAADNRAHAARRRRRPTTSAAFDLRFSS
jgi:hypothetical protein